MYRNVAYLNHGHHQRNNINISMRQPVATGISVTAANNNRGHQYLLSLAT